MSLDRLVESVDYTLKRIGCIFQMREFFQKIMFVLTDPHLSVLATFTGDLLEDAPDFCIQDLACETVGNNAFYLSRVRNTISLVGVKEHREPRLAHLWSIAAPIHKKNGTILGYLGIFVETEQVNESLIPFVEVLAKSSADHFGTVEKLDPGYAEKKWRGTFTAREFAILESVVQGKKDSEIARLHSVSVSTVRAHLNSMYEKMGLNSRIQLAALYYQHLYDDSVSEPSGHR